MYYEFMDEVLGQFMRILPPGTIVMVVSDHLKGSKTPKPRATRDYLSNGPGATGDVSALWPIRSCLQPGLDSETPSTEVVRRFQRWRT